MTMKTSQKTQYAVFGATSETRPGCPTLTRQVLIDGPFDSINDAQEICKSMNADARCYFGDDCEDGYWVDPIENDGCGWIGR